MLWRRSSSRIPMAEPVSRTPADSRVQALLVVYQTERQDQQTSGNQSRALLGTGLAYAAAVAALLSRGSAETTESLLVLAAPLPLVALIAFLVIGIANVQQRAKYLVLLEQELERYLSLPSTAGDRRFELTVPNGFRRSELVFAPRPAQSRGYVVGGAPPLLRAIMSHALGALTHGVMYLVEIGLIVYAVDRAGLEHRTLAISFYGVCVAIQVAGLVIALRPGLWERPAGVAADSAGSAGDGSGPATVPTQDVI